jgi:hypothetical protein
MLLTMYFYDSKRDCKIVTEMEDDTFVHAKNSFHSLIHQHYILDALNCYIKLEKLSWDKQNA